MVIDVIRMADIANIWYIPEVAARAVESYGPALTLAATRHVGPDVILDIYQYLVAVKSGWGDGDKPLRQFSFRLSHLRGT